METLERIVASVDERSTKGVARVVSRLIATKAIQPSTRMPTTRVLAERLGLSAGSISDAWRLLVADGLLETRGRKGTFVVDPDRATPWRRFRGVQGAAITIDLSTGFPDARQLIDLRPYLARLASAAPYTGYPDEELDPSLALALRPHLPFEPGPENTLLATHVIGALGEVLPAIGPPTTKVIVSEPEFAPYLDLLERNRFHPIAVPLTSEGPDLEAVRSAIDEGARAIILQPRVHNPSGVATTRRRLRAIAELCASKDVWIFDGDFYGGLLSAPAMSAAEWAPAHTLYMRAFSKDIHPDIRVAVMIGAPRLIREAHRRRVGGFEVSRINQDLLRLLLDDPARLSQLDRARQEYTRRQDAFADILEHEGIHVARGGGFNVWVPVRSEADSLVYLASKGIGVAPGRPFQTSTGASPHIRVSTASLGQDLDAIALEIVRAAGAGRARR